MILTTGKPQIMIRIMLNVIQKALETADNDTDNDQKQGGLSTICSICGPLAQLNVGFHETPRSEKPIGIHIKRR